MIVNNMNLHEVWENIAKELSKLEWKRDALFPKTANEFRRNYSYPVWKLYDYKSPMTHNPFVIYFYKEHPFAKINGGFLFIMFYKDNKRYVVKWADSEDPHIIVLTSHFLQRYNERCLKRPELSANEVAVNYFCRNGAMQPVGVDERINKHIKEYGEYAGLGYMVHDGFCFMLSAEEAIKGSDDTVKLSLFTTFMPLSEMSDTQREAIYEECMKDLDDMRD